MPHVTLKSIANNPEIRDGMTRQQIDVAIAKLRRPGNPLRPALHRHEPGARYRPVYVEAVPAPTVRSLDDIDLRDLTRQR